MALTVPPYTYGQVTTICFDVDYFASTLRINLRDDQLAATTDEDLAARMAAFRTALIALLPTNQNSVGARIEWNSTSTVSVNP
jgi:hypothetical protein